MEEKIFLPNLERKKKAIGLIHKIYLNQLKTKRKYTAFTKTKSEVRGGGKKPWRQKGTGNARAGSTRSPLWVGGGVSFGPKPRIVIKKSNKKERRLAILSALYLKKKECIFIEETFFDEINIIKTKKILEIFKKYQLNPNTKLLFIVEKPNKFLWLSTRNLKNITITTENCLNIEQLLKTNYIVLSNKTLNSINLTYGKSYT
jgi:large subunit ribosomal protein L4